MADKVESANEAWIRSQLAPITHEERIVALQEAIAHLERAGTLDQDFAISGPALAWIQHIHRHEQQFEGDPFVTAEDVLARLRWDLEHMRAIGRSHWGLEDALGHLLQ